ncbi:LytR/AlgR family response regulator transcription factor [Faecalicatena orotica]|uniref:LytR/AlgR family response regulator transcription factor n=1 Tax=Faecalicatena orotica TaxID=1544 RepID=UPI003216FDC2
MIRIAVVDDEKAMRDMVCKCIKQTMKEDEKESIEILEYTSGESFLEQVKNGELFDILFTDIQMSEMDGMELGKKIREAHSKMYIVFITSYAEYAVESYMIEAYQYILKQDMEYRLPDVARRLIDKISLDSRQYRMLKINEGTVKLYYKDIIYIYKAKGGKYVTFVAGNGEYRERTTLHQVYKELGSKAFVMVERGYIVNMKHIHKLSGDTIYLENGYEVKISRAKLAAVKKEINLYWGK